MMSDNPFDSAEEMSEDTTPFDPLIQVPAVLRAHFDGKDVEVALKTNGFVSLSVQYILATSGAASFLSYNESPGVKVYDKNSEKFQHLFDTHIFIPDPNSDKHLDSITAAWENPSYDSDQAHVVLISFMREGGSDAEAYAVAYLEASQVIIVVTLQSESLDHKIWEVLADGFQGSLPLVTLSRNSEGSQSDVIPESTVPVLTKDPTADRRNVRQQQRRAPMKEVEFISHLPFDLSAALNATGPGTAAWYAQMQLVTTPVIRELLFLGAYCALELGVDYGSVFVRNFILAEGYLPLTSRFSKEEGGPLRIEFFGEPLFWESSDAADFKHFKPDMLNELTESSGMDFGQYSFAGNALTDKSSPDDSSDDGSESVSEAPSAAALPVANLTEVFNLVENLIAQAFGLAKKAPLFVSPVFNAANEVTHALELFDGSARHETHFRWTERLLSGLYTYVDMDVEDERDEDDDDDEDERMKKIVAKMKIKSVRDVMLPYLGVTSYRSTFDSASGLNSSLCSHRLCELLATAEYIQKTGVSAKLFIQHYGRHTSGGVAMAILGEAQHGPLRGSDIINLTKTLKLKNRA